MTNYAKLIRTIEEQLSAMNLSEEDATKQRKIMYKAFRVEMTGFKSPDIELPEGSILIGVSKGVLCQAVAREGQLWVNDKPFNAISAAAIEASGNPTMSGWTFWTMAYIPRTGFVQVQDIRATETRAYNSKRS